MLFSGSYLIANENPVLGYTMLSIGALWAASHTALVAWLGRKRRS